ncbi:MAG: MFS transporter [Candidatus Calescibacterium sp.]|nr:MFS transporter [Candidatus Calescibacterium sp.]MCX7972552.1 MFS transporter [bacterium]MDW8195555.1 MFS transporter [Candidatus Calescibacterium sp.]
MNYFSFFSTLYLFLPLIIQEYNLPEKSIGIIGSLFSLGSVISGFSLSNFIEKSKNKNSITQIIILLNIILLILLTSVKSYILLSFIVFMIGYLGSSFVGINMSRSQNKGITIGISSLGFIIGYLLGGMIGNYKTMIFIISFLFLISLIFSFVYPIFSKEQGYEEEKKLNSLEILKKNWFIYLALFLRHTGAAGIWLYFSYILLSYYNYNIHIIGILHAINIIAQTISNPIIYMFVDKKNRSLMLLISTGYILSAIYFLFFPMFKNFWILALLQLILGLSFTALYLGNIEYLSKNNNEKITSITLVSSTFSFSNLSGALLSSVMIEKGYIWLFINGFILSTLSFFLILLILRNQEN